MWYKNGLELEPYLKMSPLKWDVSQPQMFIAREIIHKQAGTELCHAQLKLASSLYCFQLKDNSGS